jgi:hypothetical protein
MPGEADDVVAQRFELDVPRSVGDEGGASGVRAVSVELGDQAASRPEKVHDVGADSDVHPRMGKVVAAQEGQEAGFELAAGVIRIKPRADRQPEVLRPPECGSKLRLGKKTAEVPEGAGGTRNRDAFSPGHVAGQEGLGPVDMDSLTAARATRSGDVHETPLGKELPERGGADVAEHGARAAGENRRHPPPLLAEPTMPDGVHTAMNAVQLLGPNASRQALTPNPEPLELSDRHNTMLVRG